MKKLPTILIKNKPYTTVQSRIQYLAEEKAGKYSIDSAYEYYPEKRIWVVRSTLTLDGQEYIGLAQEVESDDYKQVNFASALENCQTSAIGRACALAGIGIQDSFASADEVQKADNRGSAFQTNKDSGEIVNTPKIEQSESLRRGEFRDVSSKKPMGAGKPPVVAQNSFGGWGQDDVKKIIEFGGWTIRKGIAAKSNKLYHTLITATGDSGFISETDYDFIKDVT